MRLDSEISFSLVWRRNGSGTSPGLIHRTRDSLPGGTQSLTAVSLPPLVYSFFLRRWRGLTLKE